jgi:D-inositol-3-phosphate glycosyltransferase
MLPCNLWLGALYAATNHAVNLTIGKQLRRSVFKGDYWGMTEPIGASNGNANGYLRCVSMLEQLPGDQLANVRNPLGGLRGWVARTEEKLTRKVFPEVQVSSHVRGNKVAQDYLLQALLGYSTGIQFSFIVEEKQKEKFELWAARQSQGHHCPNIEIHQAIETFRSGLDRIAPDIWLDLTGTSADSLRIRDRLSSRAFPIVSVQHGVSNSKDLYECFSRILMTPSYAYDSLICSSRSCKKAVENILEEIASSFGRQFGGQIKFNGRLDTIPLCVDTEVFRPQDKIPLRKQLRIPSDAFVLLYVGYLSLFKADLSPLLPMMRRLVDKNPRSNLQFIIAGTGPESYGKALVTMVQDLNLGKNVTLLREVSDTLKQQLLGAADIFLAPCESFHESFGLTPVEAMACGLPQVVASWDGYRDTVSHGETGFHIPTYWGRCDEELRGTSDLFGWVYDHSVLSQSVYLDISYMQECLQVLIEKPDLVESMSLQSRARAVSEFSYASVARRYDELFREISAIARVTQRYPKVKRFDETAYFNFFGHFATNELSDRCLIRELSNRSLSLEKLTRLVQTELGVSIFDSPLLDHLLQSVSSDKSIPKLISVGELITRSQNEKWTADIIRRHILFLLKHGKIGLVP